MTASAVRNLELRLAGLRLDPPQAPPRGWIRAIRDALGMSARQLADRLGVSQPAITSMEQNEARGVISLATLRDAAEALDCRLVYALVPNRPLPDTLRARAAVVAERQLARVAHTMRLENQAASAGDLAAEKARLIEALLIESPRRLWDEP